MINGHRQGLVVANAAKLPYPDLLPISIEFAQVRVLQTSIAGLPVKSTSGSSRHVDIAISVDRHTVGLIGKGSAKQMDPIKTLRRRVANAK